MSCFTARDTSRLVCRVQGIIGTIHETWPGTEIILLGILPRGTDYWDGGSGRTSWPNVLTGPIESLNRELKVSLCRQPPQSSPASSLIVESAIQNLLAWELAGKDGSYVLDSLVSDLHRHSNALCDICRACIHWIMHISGGIALCRRWKAAMQT